MKAATRAKLKRLAESRPRYKTGPMKGKFKPASSVRSRPRRRRNPGVAPKANPYFKVGRKRGRVAKGEKVKQMTFFVAMPKGAKDKAAVKKHLSRVAKGRRSSTRKSALAALTRTYGAKRTSRTPIGVAELRPRRKKKAAAKAAPPRKTPKKKGTKTVAKKKKAAPKRKDGKRSKASYRRAALKGWASRRKAGTAPAKRKARRRRPIRSIYLKPRGSKKNKRYNIFRRKRGGFSISSHRNPLNNLKAALLSGAATYAGFFAARALTKVVGDALSKSATFATGTGKTLQQIIPAGGVFATAALLGPKLFGRQPVIAGALINGAAIALGDAIMAQVLSSANAASVGMLTSSTTTAATTASSGTSATAQTEVKGFDEYVQQQQLAANVEEAMALDEYVQMGANVEEALASPGLSADEVDYMQRGGAGGVFAKTVFSS